MDRLEWLGLVVWIMFVYWQPFTMRVRGRTMTRVFDMPDGTRQPIGFLSPPAWLFGVVWFILYGLMSAALFLYWNRSGTDPATSTMVAVLVNLLLNKLWTAVFNQNRLLALLVLLGILGTNVWIQVELSDQTDALTSAWLWLPYTIWTAYATLLNASLVLREQRTRNAACKRRK